MMDMKKFRTEIDIIDEKIVNLLSKRFDICRRIAIYKSQTGIPIMQPQRIEEIKHRCGILGAKYGVDQGFLKELYDVIIAEGCNLEDNVMKHPSGKHNCSQKSNQKKTSHLIKNKNSF